VPKILEISRGGPQEKMLNKPIFIFLEIYLLSNTLCIEVVKIAQKIQI
jgi:hypothetical protein